MTHEKSLIANGSIEQTLKTGDILLFSEHPTQCCMACLDCLIKKCTCSKYSHSALVVVDPPWTTLKGIYVWESSWHGQPDPQDGLVKMGVQLTPLEFYMSKYPGSVRIWVRRAPFDVVKPKQWVNIHKKVYKHAYDTRPYDWISAAFQRRIARQTDSFTCSAFVSYVLTELKALAGDTCWTTISAAELSSERKSSLVHFVEEYGADEYFGHFPDEDTDF